MAFLGSFHQNSNEGFELAIGASRTGHFHVDKDAIEFVSVGFFYDYLNSQERNRQVPSLTVRSPSGTLYTSSSEEYIEDPKLRTVMLNITNLEVRYSNAFFLFQR